MNRVGGSYIRGEGGWEQMHSASFRLIRQTVTRARDIGKYFVHFASLPLHQELSLFPRGYIASIRLYTVIRAVTVLQIDTVSMSMSVSIKHYNVARIADSRTTTKAQ